MAIHPEVKIQHKIDRTKDIIRDLKEKLRDKEEELKNLEKQLDIIKEHT